MTIKVKTLPTDARRGDVAETRDGTVWIHDGGRWQAVPEVAGEALAGLMKERDALRAAVREMALEIGRARSKAEPGDATATAREVAGDYGIGAALLGGDPGEGR